MDLNHIGKLAEIMKANDITLLEISEDNISVKLERGSQTVAVQPFAVAAAAPAAPAAAPQITGAPAAELRRDEGNLVKSPTVGVFYASPTPDSAPYATIGTAVKTGDILCIIEAMKLMNEITADCDGVVTEVLAGNGQVVEFDQPLFRIQ